MQVYEFKNEQEAADSPLNPIKHLAAFAKAGVPLLHVCRAR